MPNFLRAPSIQFFIVALTSVFFLVDPFAAVPAFLVIAANATHVERRKLAVKASVTCFIVLTGFALTGSLIFRFFWYHTSRIRDCRRNHSHSDGTGDASGASLGNSRNSR